MPTLRLLLALTLIALGTTGAAFAISGYFDPRLSPQGAKANASPSEAAKAKLELAVPKPRQRFIAVEAKAKPAAAATAAVPTTPLRAKTSVAKAPVKKPPPPPAKDANVQQTTAWWSLAGLFKN
jgi:hypothetical protein